MKIEEIIDLQGQIIRELEKLKNKDQSEYLADAYVQQEVARNFAIAYQLKLKPKKVRTIEDKNEYMRKYLRDRELVGAEGK